MIDFRYWFTQLALYAGKNPWEFLYITLIFLTPFFALSAYMSWKLAKEIDLQEKEKRKKVKMEAGIAKAKLLKENKNPAPAKQSKPGKQSKPAKAGKQKSE